MLGREHRGESVATLGLQNTLANGWLAGSTLGSVGLTTT